MSEKIIDLVNEIVNLRKLTLLANNGSSVLTGHDLPSAGKQPLLTLSANKPYKQANHAKKTFCSPSIVEQRNIETRRTNIGFNSNYFNGAIFFLCCGCWFWLYFLLEICLRSPGWRCHC